MNSPLAPLLLATLLILGGATSCLEQPISNRVDHTLAFSTDTLHFDTIFTTIGTSRRTIKVYNPHPLAVEIDRVELAGGEASPYYINCDGRVGTTFEQIKIAKHDSLYLFVGVNINPNQADAPILVEDSILFTTHTTVHQNIKLLAYGRDVELLKGQTYTSDAQLTAKRPYLIYDSLVVAPNATLQLAAGASLYFHQGASLEVRGALNAQGTLAQPIHLRGDRLDSLFVGLPYDKLAGQWRGVHFHPTSGANTLSHTYLRGAEQAIVIDSAHTDTTHLTITSSTIHNASRHLIEANHAKLRIYNTQLSNAGGSLLKLQGGDVEVIHSTLANYYIFDIISSPMVQLSSTMERPQRALFANTIIYGEAIDVAIDQSENSTLLFDHTLLKSKGEDDAQFVATLWSEDPLFVATGEAYHYDFTLYPLSPAIAAGNSAYVRPPLDVDALGVPRTLPPDLGAYQCTKEVEEK